MSDKDPWGLRSTDAAEEGINGVQERIKMSFTLFWIKQKKLPVLSGYQVLCWVKALRWFPLWDVIFNRLCDFLLQSLELIQLKGKQESQHHVVLSMLDTLPFSRLLRPDKFSLGSVGYSEESQDGKKYKTFLNCWLLRSLCYKPVDCHLQGLHRFRNASVSNNNLTSSWLWWLKKQTPPMGTL